MPSSDSYSAFSQNISNLDKQICASRPLQCPSYSHLFNVALVLSMSVQIKVHLLNKLKDQIPPKSPTSSNGSRQLLPSLILSSLITLALSIVLTNKLFDWTILWRPREWPPFPPVQMLPSTALALHPTIDNSPELINNKLIVAIVRTNQRATSDSIVLFSL